MSMSTSTAPPSIESTASEKPAQPALEEAQMHSLVYEQRNSDIWMLLLAARFMNALCMHTFFQPDEYYQALEPAWQMAFGSQSGAWITWEWQHQLRSSLHPALFAAVYAAANRLMESLSCFPQFRAIILAVLPNIAQAYFAALGDYYTWKLSEKIYGRESNASWAALLLTYFSPWQWFCSTRTFSNSLETTLTITALNYWPWGMSTDTVLDTGAPSTQAKTPTSAKNSVFQSDGSISSLRISLVLAAFACILRPTNGLIWFCILMPAVTRLFTTTRLDTSDYQILAREALICGSAVLLISSVSDRIYFGEWTFPIYQFLNFNINQDLAVFYGRNDWHYYLSQGLPLLLTTYVPFAAIGLWNSASLAASDIRSLLTTTILVTVATLSLISHKEVRFIYPLLPLLHILAAPVITSFFITTTTKTTHPPPSSSILKAEQGIEVRRKPLLALLILLNVAIAGFTTVHHQRGVLSVVKYLRQEYELIAPRDEIGAIITTPTSNETETFAAFLMPCHSTPWRSQLFYPGLKAWALTCEPPLHLTARTEERKAYRDEADRFYDDPVKFLKEEVNTKERPWPKYVVGFGGIEESLREYYEGEMKGFKVQEKWRNGNSAWHDDWRRQGDVVVWEFVEG